MLTDLMAMMLLGVFPLLLLTAFPDTVAEMLQQNPKSENFAKIFEQIREHEVSVQEECGFQAVLNYLNLTRNSEMYTMTRPVKHHNQSTWIFLEMKVYAILDVRETDQSFISYIWIYLRWDNEHVWWNPEQFCGLDHILVPTQVLWIPDLTIEEMTEQDKASPSPYLNIRSHGWVEFRNDQVVISSCKMQVYRFPFDIQSCNISFKSIMHSNEEIMLFYNSNNTEITEWTHEAMQTQFEWLFVSMTVMNKTVNDFGFNQTMIIYTINMKRRSVLYIANFLLPVFFFFCLDFGSLLMSDSGEKVGFKITLLLSVTVMQLILNDILPCSSDRIPLTVAYCIGIFTLMLISLLETIFVIYLIGKDAQKDNETPEKQSINDSQEEKLSNIQGCFTVLKKQSHMPSGENTSALNNEGGTSKHSEVSLAMETMSEQLGKSKKTITLFCSGHEDTKRGYWTRVAKKINKVFAFTYIISAILFLLTIAMMWYPPHEQT